MTKKNQRMLRIHTPKVDNQSPVIVCLPDGSRHYMTSEAYHKMGKFGKGTFVFDPNGRRMFAEER